MIVLEFKTKVVDGEFQIPVWKRSHVKHYDHRISGFINSNLVGTVVNREVVKQFGESLKCGRKLSADSLPDGVSVKGDFMKTVTLTF